MLKVIYIKAKDDEEATKNRSAMELLDFTKVWPFAWRVDFVPEEKNLVSSGPAPFDKTLIYLTLMCCLTPSNMKVRFKPLQC